MRRNWIEIAGLYFPSAVLVDRSAVDGRPAEDGSLFLDSGPERAHPGQVSLPGLVLKPRHGPGPLAGDMPFGSLFRSGQARTALDNLRPSRARAGVARTLDDTELEEWLERIARNRGEDELRMIRDEAREVASSLDALPRQATLDRLISALLGTGGACLVTPAGRARGRREPFDASRLTLFETLHGALAGNMAPVIPEPPDPGEVFAFFESYFSNFIEGTEFALEEAEAIVFEDLVPAERPQDAHDVLGVFAAAARAPLRARVPESADDLLELLRLLNRSILERRPEVGPGEWKRQVNRAGGTVFVAPEQVVGTLREAWRFYRTLPAGFARAAFAMFVVTEIHPFADGNGRVARLLMNAELSAEHQSRVVIPLCYRIDYLGALRALSRQSEPAPLLRMLERAQRWGSLVDWSTMPGAVEQLDRTNALVPPDEAEERGLVLLDPTEK